LEKALAATAGTARAADLDRLERDVTREFERVRGDVATRLTLRETREQALNEQIDLLRIAIDEAARKLAATARAEDVERLRQDADRNLERIRNEFNSRSAIWSAREQS